MSELEKTKIQSKQAIRVALIASGFTFLGIVVPVIINKLNPPTPTEESTERINNAIIEYFNKNKEKFQGEKGEKGEAGSVNLSKMEGLFKWESVTTSVSEFDPNCEYRFKIIEKWDGYIGATFYPVVVRRDLIMADYGGDHATSIKIGDVIDNNWMTRGHHGDYKAKLWKRCIGNK